MAKILVIDDDPGFTKLITYQLQDAGFEVDVAYKKADALQKTATQTYDLILLDIFFPNRETGFALLNQLSSDLQTKKTPIVLITALTNELFREEKNIDHYLQIARELISKSDGSPHIVKRVQQILFEK